jgi:hypothetical protein
MNNDFPDTSHSRFSGLVRFTGELKTEFGDTYVEASITNLSPEPWKPSGQHPTHVSYHVLDEDWKVTLYDGSRTPLPPAGLAPQETLCLPVKIDHLPPGTHRICLSVVTEGVTWHDSHPGFSPHIRTFTILPSHARTPVLARSPDALTAVYCINEAFIPLLLSLCRHLRAQGARCVLIIENSIQPHRIADLFTEIGCDIVSYRSCELIHLDSRVSRIITHAFGSVEATNHLISRLEAESLEVYADSFLNNLAISGDFELSHFRLPVAKSYFWDFIPPSIKPKLESVLVHGLPRPHEVIAVTEFNKFWNHYARCFFLSSPDLKKEPTSYVVLYLRYWQTSFYADLDLEQIHHSLQTTLQNTVDRESTVVIKFDERAGSFNREVFNRLSQSGLHVIECGEYLRNLGYPEEYGLLKTEILFSLDLLCNANAHFVLDSTQGYAIALHSRVRRPTNLYYGLTGLLGSKGTSRIHDYMDDRIHAQISMVSNLIRRPGVCPKGRNDYPFCLTLEHQKA